MKWLNRINPFRAGTSTLSNPDQWLVDAILGGMSTAAGVTVTPLKALGVSTVFACVNRVSQSVATIPLKLYRSLPGGGRVEATEHPLFSLLHDSPNPEMTSGDFRRAVQSHLTLRNNGYALIVRNGLGQVSELWPIDYADVQVRRNSVTRELEYTVQGKAVHASQVLHLRSMTVNGILGLDTVSTGRDTIALAIALQDNASKFFANGSRPGSILEHPGVLGDEAAKRLRESFERLYKGSENAYKVAVLEEGLKFVSNRTDNKDSQFLESKKEQSLAICQLFGIPPHKVGILDNATFSNIEHQNIEYVQDTLLSACSAWEQTLNMKLLTEIERRTYSFGFVLDGLLRGDIKTRYEAYAIARNWGWLNADDIRGLENMNPLPDGKGKVYLQPLNMVEAGTPPAAPKFTPPPAAPEAPDPADPADPIDPLDV